jgi:hypothetical protein
MTSTGRFYLCQRCRLQVIICRRCDYGQIYCSNNCSKAARCEALRASGRRYHQGDRISTGFVESAVNYVVAKRFTKRQQMQWSPRGAHLLLQMRTKVLNGELEQTFREWHPGFRAVNDEKFKKVAHYWVHLNKRQNCFIGFFAMPQLAWL